MTVKSIRASLFARQRKSSAKTINGQIRALLAFFERPGVVWGKGNLATTTVIRNKKTNEWTNDGAAYCLQGAMIALGFKEDNGRPFISSSDELSRCILRAANDSGYQVHTVWRLNDQFTEGEIVKVLEHAIEMDC
jgi:hypothetical protein